MVQLYIEDDIIELEDTQITITKQVGDLLDIANVKSSYTNSFNIPKTPHNQRVFNYLGVVGSTSKMPYRKVNCSLYYNGNPLILNGWLDLKETTDTYKVNIIDGIIDFFKEIENHSMNTFIDLSELNHTKTLDQVVNSQHNKPYRYILADFGGKVGKPTLFHNMIYINHLLPSVSIKYLWGKIFEKAGFTYSGDIFHDEDFTNLWLTYSLPRESKEEVVFKGQKNKFKEFTSPQCQENYFCLNNHWDITESVNNDIIEVLPDKMGFKIKKTGRYKFKLRFQGIGKGVRNEPIVSSNLMDNFQNVIPSLHAGYLEYYRNGQFIHKILYYGGEVQEYIIIGNNGQEIYEGDVIEFKFSVLEKEGYKVQYFEHERTNVDLYSLDENIRFTESLSTLKVKDFVKEIIIRFGLIPIIKGNNIHFITQSERFDLSNAIDWTSKYIQQEKETYTLGKYGQLNVFRHKYSDNANDYNDGVIHIDNQNLKDKEIVYNSITHSEEEDNSVVFPFIKPLIPMYKKEVKETDNGIEFSYKVDKNKFYLLKSILRNVSLRFADFTNTTQSITTNSYHVGTTQGIYFNDLIPKYYKHYSKLLNNCKIKEITLNLNIIDIVNLDLSRIYYFEQEAGYFILNKLTYTTKGQAKGKFIQI